MRHVTISAAFAQQIVDSAKAIVGKDINFIDKNGFIIASTNRQRIGEFHEVGHQVVKYSESKEVEESNRYQGSLKGINYPIFIGEEVIGVIGITGEPSEVSRYGFLLTKISEIFIKEYLLEVSTLDEWQRMNKLVLSLIYHNTEGLEELIDQYEIDRTQRYVVIQMMINKRCNPSNLSMIKKETSAEIEQLGSKLCTYIYPNEMIFILSSSQYQAFKQNLAYYEKKYDTLLNIGVGTEELIDMVHISYHFSKIATKHSVDNERFYTLSEQMNIELLIGSLEEKIKVEYCQKVIGKLSEEEINVLKTYFRNDLSLKQTADELFIHKNTLQYKLNQVKEKTGFDPRHFKNAVTLYMAIRMICYI